jgi:hypothetical protein
MINIINGTLKIPIMPVSKGVLPSWHQKTPSQKFSRLYLCLPCPLCLSRRQTVRMIRHLTWKQHVKRKPSWVLQGISARCHPRQSAWKCSICSIGLGVRPYQSLPRWIPRKRWLRHRLGPCWSKVHRSPPRSMLPNFCQLDVFRSWAFGILRISLTCWVCRSGRSPNL